MRGFIGMGIGIIFTLLACQPKSHPRVLQSEEIALANPIITIDSILFSEQTTIHILPPHPQANVHYSTDNQAVSKTSPLCPTSLTFDKNTDIQFKAFHPDIQPSESVSFAVRKIDKAIQPKVLPNSTQAKNPYEGKGLDALSDVQKGTTNFKANQAWLGYQYEVIEFNLQFEESTYCQQIILSTLCDHDSWIFNPTKIALVQNDKVIASKNIDVPKERQAATGQFLELLVTTSLTEATLKIYMDKIPDWHIGKTTPSWFFIDEIIVQ